MKSAIDGESTQVDVSEAPTEMIQFIASKEIPPWMLEGEAQIHAAFSLAKAGNPAAYDLVMRLSRTTAEYQARYHELITTINETTRAVRAKS